MDDAQLLRYSRHILLPELGIEAQEKFAASHALVVGAGGLGAPVAQFLAASGVGTITLADPDIVDLTNLQRQILYASADVGHRKVDAAQARLASINPDVRVETIAARLGPDELAPLASRADVVIACCKTSAPPPGSNPAWGAAQKPLFPGAATLFGGKIALLEARD